MSPLRYAGASPRTRILWLLLVLGWVCVVVGIAGVVLPLLPGVPILLIALWAFSKSSKRFHNWLYTHEVYGPAVASLAPTSRYCPASEDSGLWRNGDRNCHPCRYQRINHPNNCGCGGDGELRGLRHFSAELSTEPLTDDAPHQTALTSIARGA